jgi:hypothetical protein
MEEGRGHGYGGGEVQDAITKHLALEPPNHQRWVGVLGSLS